MVGELEFERPIVQLRNKIAELKEFTKTADVDLSSEIEKLESRLEKLEKDIYEQYKTMGPCANCPTSKSTDNIRLYC